VQNVASLPAQRVCKLCQSRQKRFFKRAGKGESVNLGKIYGNDVIKQTLQQQTLSIRRVLREQMSDVVERAARFLEIKFPPKKGS
jgi:hypothetical protein